jgi:AcrR family transcriptional regulator
MSESERRLTDEPLPRGRHALDPELVARSQRHRLLAAAGQALLEGDSWSLNVSEICSLAGVSRATFYVHFEDRSDCLTQAFDTSFRGLRETIAPACAAAESWPQNVLGAVQSAFAWVGSAPPRAAPCLIDPAVGDGALAEEALIAGVVYVLARRLRTGQGEQLPDLAAEMGAFLLLPYRGA